MRLIRAAASAQPAVSLDAVLAKITAQYGGSGVVDSALVPPLSHDPAAHHSEFV